MSTKPSQILTGDCLEILPTLPKASVQMVFLDPPYNIGLDYGNGTKADQLSPAKYLSQMERLLTHCIDLLTPSGSLWFLISERWADHIGLMLSDRLPRRNRIIWRETFGQYREDQFGPGHRHLFWHVMDRKQSPFYADEIRIESQRMRNGDTRAKGPRVPDDVWEIPRLVGTAKERLGEHPCQLPETLIERVIRCSTQKGDLVLDPTAGSGTILRCAQRLERRSIGIEQQPAFVRLINKRLNRSWQRKLF